MEDKNVSETGENKAQDQIELENLELERNPEIVGGANLFQLLQKIESSLKRDQERDIGLNIPRSQATEISPDVRKEPGDDDDAILVSESPPSKFDGTHDPDGFDFKGGLSLGGFDVPFQSDAGEALPKNGPGGFDFKGGVSSEGFSDGGKSQPKKNESKPGGDFSFGWSATSLGGTGNEEQDFGLFEEVKMVEGSRQSSLFEFDFNVEDDQPTMDEDGLSFSLIKIPLMTLQENAKNEFLTPSLRSVHYKLDGCFTSRFRFDREEDDFGEEKEGSSAPIVLLPPLLTMTDEFFQKAGMSDIVREMERSDRLVGVNNERSEKLVMNAKLTGSSIVSRVKDLIATKKKMLEYAIRARKAGKCVQKTAKNLSAIYHFRKQPKVLTNILSFLVDIDISAPGGSGRGGLTLISLLCTCKFFYFHILENVPLPFMFDETMTLISMIDSNLSFNLAKKKRVTIIRTSNVNTSFTDSALRSIQTEKFKTVLFSLLLQYSKDIVEFKLEADTAIFTSFSDSKIDDGSKKKKKRKSKSSRRWNSRKERKKKKRGIRISKDGKITMIMKRKMHELFTVPPMKRLSHALAQLDNLQVLALPSFHIPKELIKRKSFCYYLLTTLEFSLLAVLSESKEKRVDIASEFLQSCACLETIKMHIHQFEIPAAWLMTHTNKDETYESIVKLFDAICISQSRRNTLQSLGFPVWTLNMTEKFYESLEKVISFVKREVCLEICSLPEEFSAKRHNYKRVDHSASTDASILRLPQFLSSMWNKFEKGETGVHHPAISVFLGGNNQSQQGFTNRPVNRGFNFGYTVARTGEIIKANPPYSSHQFVSTLLQINGISITTNIFSWISSASDEMWSRARISKLTLFGGTEHSDSPEFHKNMKKLFFRANIEAIELLLVDGLELGGIVELPKGGFFAASTDMSLNATSTGRNFDNMFRFLADNRYSTTEREKAKCSYFYESMLLFLTRTSVRDVRVVSRFGLWHTNLDNIDDFFYFVSLLCSIIAENQNLRSVVFDSVEKMGTGLFDANSVLNCELTDLEKKISQALTSNKGIGKFQVFDCEILNEKAKEIIAKRDGVEYVKKKISIRKVRPMYRPKGRHILKHPFANGAFLRK